MSQAEGAVIAAIIAGVVALVSAVFTFVTARQTAKDAAEASSKTAALSAEVSRLTNEEKLRREYQLEYASERVARELLMDKDWTLRSFEILSHHLAGFGDDDLRKVLVRAGAIRFTSKQGKEVWGLLDRNLHLLGAKEVPAPTETRAIMTPAGALVTLAAPSVGPRISEAHSAFAAAAPARPAK